jgi:transcriptional regulator
MNSGKIIPLLAGRHQGEGKTVSPAAAVHGYGIVRRLDQISRAVVKVNQGSLYPALQWLEQKGWVQAEWKQSETGRDARFYSLTASGRKQLAAEKKLAGHA